MTNKPSRLERRIEASVATGICAAVSASAAFAFSLSGLSPLALFAGLVACVLSVANVAVNCLVERDIEVIRGHEHRVVFLPLDDDDMIEN